jgi:HPr serine kinase-like protein
VIRYALHDLTVEVESEEESAGRELDRVLDSLFWQRTQAPAAPSSLSLSIRRNGAGHEVPASARSVLRTEDYRGFEEGEDYYLTDGATLLRVRSRERCAEVFLAPGFFSREPDSRHQFWIFALVKLLQGIEVFSLHGAGLIAPGGAGVLVVGDSGSGKSTLTIGLIRRGWRYLSDDAVLLRRCPAGIEALALRRHFYVDGSASDRYTGLSLGHEIADSRGGRRRAVAVERAFPAQRSASCLPVYLLFSRIVRRPTTDLVPVETPVALGRLLAQSAQQAFERRATSKHLLVLTELLRQTRFYDLEAGTDLHENPALLEGLLAEAPRAARAAS